MPKCKEPKIPDAILDQLLAGADPKTAFEPDGLLDEIKRALAERTLNPEMDHHLPSEGLTELLDKPSVRDKCRRNLGEPSQSRPIDITAGPVFNVFFPEGAFYRIDFERSQG